MGTGLLVFVWVLQTVYFVIRLIQHRDMPTLSMFEFLFFFSWLMVTISLLVNRFFNMELLVFIVNVVGFAVLTLNLLTDPNAAMPIAQEERLNDMLIFHIVMAVCSYAAFTLATILSGMYLFLHRSLKNKKFAIMKRFPSLDKIDKWILVTTSIGTPLLVLSLSLGVVTIIAGNHSIRMLFDSKVFSSVLVLGAYSHYFLLRLILKVPGTRLAAWTIGSFAVLLMNLLLNPFSMFH